MFKGSIQKIMYEVLKKEGRIEKLGQTYRSYSKSPRRTGNTPIENFISEVKEIHPNAKLELGKRGGLDTATLTLE